MAPVVPLCLLKNQRVHRALKFKSSIMKVEERQLEENLRL